EKISEEIEVVFGNVWNPNNLVNPAKLWLSAENITTDDLSRVDTINDLANSNHFTQENNARKPLVVADAITNKNALQFDGFDDQMSNTSVFLRNISRNTGVMWAFSIIKNT